MGSGTGLERLRELLRQRSIARGDFVLASGRRATFYIDARCTTMSGEGLALIGALGLERLAARGWAPQLVGGLTLGADPVAYAIAVAAQGRGRALDAFSVRRQAKTHGTARRIEGCFTPGATVGVLGVLAVVDREEGGRAALAAAGHALEVLVSVAELGLR